MLSPRRHIPVHAQTGKNQEENRKEASRSRLRTHLLNVLKLLVQDAQGELALRQLFQKLRLAVLRTCGRTGNTVYITAAEKEGRNWGWPNSGTAPAG